MGFIYSIYSIVDGVYLMFNGVSMVYVLYL